ncbi:hypothetical protein FG379_002902, partial [Cryptosporidium bovis]|uniref:uncharacterized protein n=1 Tax=Cryptosporidium bovis TaxID=310047 RepID=UPI00351A57DD
MNLNINKNMLSILLSSVLITTFFYDNYLQVSRSFFKVKDVFLSDVSFLKAEGGVGTSQVGFESLTSIVLQELEVEKIVVIAESMGYPGDIDPSEKCSKVVISGLLEELKTSIYGFYYSKSRNVSPTGHIMSHIDSGFKESLLKLLRCLLYKILTKNKDISFKRNPIGCAPYPYFTASAGKKLSSELLPILNSVKSKLEAMLHDPRKTTRRSHETLRLSLELCESDISGLNSARDSFKTRKNDCKKYIRRDMAAILSRHTGGGRGGGEGDREKKRGGGGGYSKHGPGGSSTDTRIRGEGSTYGSGYPSGFKGHGGFTSGSGMHGPAHSPRRRPPTPPIDYDLSDGGRRDLGPSDPSRPQQLPQLPPVDYDPDDS